MKTIDKGWAPLTLATFLALAGFAVTGCEQEGPLEDAGEEIDDAVDDAADELRE